MCTCVCLLKLIQDCLVLLRMKRLTIKINLNDQQPLKRRFTQDVNDKEDNSTNYFLNLPNETIETILEYVSDEDRFHFYYTSKSSFDFHLIAQVTF